MAGLALYTVAGAGNWTSDFAGPGLVRMWGPGGPGGGGTAGSKGGGGGGGGAEVSVYLNFKLGQNYTFFIGSTTIGGITGGAPVPKGPPSTFGDILIAASGHSGLLDSAAPGGQEADSLGDIISAGSPGSFRSLFQFEGADGGKAGGLNGGAGASSVDQNNGVQGSAPGGGGSGGGQFVARYGGAGGNGGIEIIQIPPDSRPGYKAIGFSDPDNYVYAAASFGDSVEFDDDGEAWVEATGAPGGSRGGNGFLGGAAGGGGAYAAAKVELFRDVLYTVRRGTPGASSNYGVGTGITDGQPSFLFPTALRARARSRTGGTATLYLANPSTDTDQRHGFVVGQSVTITGMNAAYNGVVTITGVNDLHNAIQYAVAGSEALTTFSATGNVELTAGYLVYAEGGKGNTGSGLGGTLGTPGLAANSIGTIKFDGEWGTAAGATGANGGLGGAGGGPTDGLGGQGGNAPLNSAGNAGDPGSAPGGAGGGGRGLSGGHGGAGAQGGLTIRYVKSYFQANVEGTHVENITRMWMNHPTEGVVELTPSIIRPALAGGQEAQPLARMRESPLSLKRQFPDWIPDGKNSLYNAAVGTFNWRLGAAGLREKVLADDFRFCVFGDSVSEGWTSFNILTLSGTQDFPRSFPRRAQAQLVSDSTASTVAGTGLVIPSRDDAWVRTGSAWSNGVHYLYSQNTGSIITLTPYVAGNQVEVVTSGAGGFTVKINGVSVSNITPSGANGTLKRTVYSVAGAPGFHTIELRPTGSSLRSCLFGAGTTMSTGGITCDNWSQGGSTAYGTGQAAWSDTGAAPDRMLKTWTQFNNIYGVGNHPDACVIFLGGNDSSDSRTPTQIADAHKTMIDEIRVGSPNMKIILMPDIWTEDRDAALMQAAFDKNVAMVDVFFLSKRLNSVFGGLYNGDIYGHLNAVRGDGGVPGSDWMGQFLTDALLSE